MNPNGFQKCSSFLENARTITRGVAHFSMTYLVTELNHIVFSIGHLNAIYYFKCSTNSELKRGLLGIILTEPTTIFRIFGNVFVFLIKPQSCRKIENRKQKRERETYLAYLDGPVSSPPGRPSPSPPPPCRLPPSPEGRRRVAALRRPPPPSLSAWLLPGAPR